LKDYYALLEIAANASQEDVKRAFRHQIARYHPDKVQHLGREFQAMAADRAAELTEAYRILSDASRRAEYDRSRVAAPPPPPAPAAQPAEPPPTEPSGEPTMRPPPRASRERASRDEFVRKVTMARFTEGLVAAAGDGYSQLPVRGFDVACTPKSRLFGRSKDPRLLGRFVDRVDAATITETLTRAAQSAGDADRVCVFLIGSGMAPRGELEAAIAQQRRKSPASGAKVSLIPVDARDWDAHVPVDAPPVVKRLLERLRQGP
jgi:curved DNA-binding protein CbpA